MAFHRLGPRLFGLALPLLTTAAFVGCGGADSPSFGNGQGGGGDGGASSGDTSSSAAPATTTGPGEVTSSSSATSSQAGPTAGSGGEGPGVTGSGGSGDGGASEGGAGQGGDGQGGDGDGGDGSGGSEPLCGNGTCNDGETCESCEDDCGPCVDDCDEHADCDDDQICDDGECSDALGRNYEFTLVSAFFTANDPATNTPWDLDASAPDPYVELCTATVCPAGVTTVRDNDYTPTWNQGFTQLLDGGSEVYFRLWDEDINLDDFALQTGLGSAEQWIDVVRNEGGTYVYEDASGISLTIEVEPQ